MKKKSLDKRLIVYLKICFLFTLYFLKGWRVLCIQRRFVLFFWGIVAVSLPVHQLHADPSGANLENPPPNTTIYSDGEEEIKVKPHKKSSELSSALNGGSRHLRSYAPSSSTNSQLFSQDDASVAMKRETRAFGSMPLPIAGGEFAPYLGPGSTYEPPPATWLPRSFPAWMDQDTVTGDWGGWRSWLKNRGISIGGRWLMEWNGNVGGGRKHSGKFADEEAISVDLDMQKLLGVHLGTIHYLMTMRQGSTGLMSAIPSLDSVQEIAGGGTTTPGYDFTRLTRLSWEMLWNKYVRTEIGEMNAESDFEQSSSYWGANLYCQFVNNGICGMPQSIAMNSGYTWYPGSSPGGYIKIYPTGDDKWLVSAGIYAEKSNFGATDNYWNLGLGNATGAFVPVQLGWHKGGSSDYEGPLQANIKIGAYWDSRWVKDVYSQLPTFAGNAFPSSALILADPKQLRSPYGAWIQADGMIERDGKDPRRGLSIFGSFTWGDPRDSVAPYFVTLGLVRKGTFRNRPNDTISIGSKMLWVNDQLTQWVKDLPQSVCDTHQYGYGGGCYAPHMENLLEINYGWRPAPWLLIRPNIQFEFSPGATNRYATATIVGLESGITF
ncbi:carbohydrate porin [Acetobacteraceae bacterium]|nr:carbohydrate porin [Acetobacteraceae bacterium]